MEKNENMEITRILDIVKSKKLGILLILLVFILLGYLYSYHYIVPKYQSTSTLLLIPNSTSESQAVMKTDLKVNTDLTINSGLIETYRSIGENPKVLKQVIQNLALDITEKEFLEKIKISVIPDTYMIQIAVTDEEPQKAMDIAKELDEVFLKEIKEIYHLNNIGIVDEAGLPEMPYNINHIKDMILFFALGIGVASIAIFAIYLFDNTIKKEEEIEKYMQLKSLGSIPIYKDKKQELVSRENAKSYVTECINTIRTNILYRNATKEAKTILITSCTPREGKSWVSANIAKAFAETDKKVLLIDSDMRKGRAHKIFKIDNKEGLSNYLYHMTESEKENINLGKNYIQETKIPNLHILTNGTLPPNPSELLESENMKELLNILKNIYDIIILDAPPCKLVTDGIILSTIVDSTILLANSEKTKMKDFKEVKKSIQMVGGEIIGTILNKKKVEGKTYRKNYYEGKGEIQGIEETKQKEIISVEETIRQAIRKLKEKEKTQRKVESKKEETIKEQEEQSNVVSQYQELLEEIREERLNKEKNEDRVKKEIAGMNEILVELLHKIQTNEIEVQNKISNQYEEILEQIKDKKENTIKEEMASMNEMLSNLKDSYLELSNKIRISEIAAQETKEENNEEKSKKIIDFSAFKKQKNKKKVYAINEDIPYEDLEQSAVYVIPLQAKKVSGSMVGTYEKTMY